MDKKNVLNIKFIGNTNKNPSIKLKKYDKRILQKSYLLSFKNIVPTRKYCGLLCLWHFTLS